MTVTHEMGLTAIRNYAYEGSTPRTTTSRFDSLATSAYYSVFFGLFAVRDALDIIGPLLIGHLGLRLVLDGRPAES
jgi:hypothetical protein